jgi:methyl-accepting chemotaxis protein
VHGIEPSVAEQGRPELTVMRMVRRHEKEYMLRGEVKYIADIPEGIDELDRQMELFALPADLRGQISALWTT